MKPYSFSTTKALILCCIPFTVLTACNSGNNSTHSGPHVSAAHSTISATPANVPANGTSVATIAVDQRDTNNMPYTGTSDVEISAPHCKACNLRENTGTTTATLSSTVAEDITIGFTVNGTASPYTAVVHFTKEWTWLAQDGGTYWYVPQDTLQAIQWDATAPSAHVSIDDQTVWHIEGYDNGYFFGPAVVKFAGYPRLCQYMIGSITPQGRVYIAFNPLQVIPDDAPAITSGTGTMTQKNQAPAFVMQMSSGSSANHVSHWSYMLQCTPDQPCWNDLPGTHNSISGTLALCGKTVSGTRARWFK